MPPSRDGDHNLGMRPRPEPGPLCPQVHALSTEPTGQGHLREMWCPCGAACHRQRAARPHGREGRERWPVVLSRLPSLWGAVRRAEQSHTGTTRRHNTGEAFPMQTRVRPGRQVRALHRAAPCEPGPCGQTPPRPSSSPAPGSGCRDLGAARHPGASQWSARTRPPPAGRRPGAGLTLSLKSFQRRMGPRTGCPQGLIQAEQPPQDAASGSPQAQQVVEFRACYLAAPRDPERPG